MVSGGGGWEYHQNPCMLGGSLPSFDTELWSASSQTSSHSDHKSEVFGLSTQTFSYINLVGGWASPLKNMKVNWDDDIPNIWENKIDVPNHQPDIVINGHFSWVKTPFDGPYCLRLRGFPDISCRMFDFEWHLWQPQSIPSKKHNSIERNCLNMSVLDHSNKSQTDQTDRTDQTDQTNQQLKFFKCGYPSRLVSIVFWLRIKELRSWASPRVLVQSGIGRHAKL